MNVTTDARDMKYPSIVQRRLAEITTDNGEATNYLTDTVRTPENSASLAAQDLFRRLLQPNPQKRLRSLTSLKGTPFFKGFCFEDVLEKKINLSERPIITRDQLTSHKKLTRSLRPCSLRRPMSASPSFGYCELNKMKRLPPWSRPQSAGSSNRRHNKLTAKFSEPLLDQDYGGEFGATYTLSSSQLLHSLMGSCSIMEGLDSDTTPTPSPQPSLGYTIKAAAQLEPGLVAKPPLPPTPTPNSLRGDSALSDDIIALKFQRWFPDAVLESEIIHKTTLKVNPFEKQNDEADMSDGGTESVELSDRENDDRQNPTNISTFIKKSRIPKNSNEDNKKTIVKFSNKNIEIGKAPEYLNKNQVSIRNKIENKKHVQKKNSSPTIVINDPDLYGCELVTDEFSTEKNTCLTPYSNSDNSCQYLNDKSLSLSDLNVVKPSVNPEKESHREQVYSDSEVYEDKGYCADAAGSSRIPKVLSDSELYKNEEFVGNIRILRNEIASPKHFEMSATNCRYTSTPIGVDDAKQPKIGISSHDGLLDKNVNITNKKDKLPSNNNYLNCEEVKEHCENLSPPVRLKPSENEIYHDHLNSYMSYLQEKQSKNNNNGVVLLNEETDVSMIREGTHVKTDKQDHVVDESNLYNQLLEARRKYGKNIEKNSGSVKSKERNLSKIPKVQDKHGSNISLKNKSGSLENTNELLYRKNSKHTTEICRASSVPPFIDSHSASPLKQNHSKSGRNAQNSKGKVKRSMSYDASSIPDISEKDSGVSSYEDIVTMIKVLEKEDLESPVTNFKVNPPVENLAHNETSSAKAILNFLDEVDRGTMASCESYRSLQIPVGNTAEKENMPDRSSNVLASSRLGSLLTMDSATLAQQVMNLTLQLEESAAVVKALEARHQQSQSFLQQQQQENESTSRRQQVFIDQLLKEKRQLAVQYETAIKEMEAKQETAIKVIEERHKVEMKKAQDKFNAAEKIRRDKWIDSKTKKIKELTVRGLEPELERMAVVHQEEMAALRRAHQGQLSEIDAVWTRRVTALREQEAAERQAAVQHEREAARHRLEQEMCQVEKSYQEQRRRLLEEVRQEKELLQRQSERLVAERQTDLEHQMDEAKQKLHHRLAEYEKQHQEDVEKLKESLETEKQAWITRQKGCLEEKEATLREELKRERDRHIELVIRRLESEASAKELAIENKIRRLKESYDAEVNDLDSTMKDLRIRLKETRSDLQKSEDLNASLTAQLSQAQNELLPLQQSVERLRKECNDAVQQREARLTDVQRELNESKQSFQDQLSKINVDKEKQLEQVYTRVKEAISKKEEALQLVTKQRDAALEQCSRLENLLETQRNHSLKL